MVCAQDSEGNQSVNMSDLSSEEQTLVTYEKIAKEWDAGFTNRDFSAPYYSTFRKLLPVGRILDAGCGTGYQTPFFLQAGYEYIGVDVSEQMLSIARARNPTARFEKMNLYSLAFPNNHFDGFWACAVLQHLPKKQVGQALQELSRVTKPGGICFIAVTEGVGERMERGRLGADDNRFFANYQEQEIQELLEKSGFRVLESACRRPKNIPSGFSPAWLNVFAQKK